MKLRKLEDFITLGHKKPGFAVLQRVELRGRDLFSQADRPTVSALRAASLAGWWTPQKNTRSRRSRLVKELAVLLWDSMLGG